MTARILATLVIGLVVLGCASAAEARLRPRCFGAAARDPDRRPCVNRALQFAVVPTPVEARGCRNSPCQFIEQRDQLNVCAFGAPPTEAKATIALVGDSHASHWRAALDTVVRRNRWRGLSITQTSCPLSRARRILPEPRHAQCIRWKRQVFAWFRRHREVRTVFAAGLSGGTGVVPWRRHDSFGTAVAGYISAFRALPSSVRRIVVIRDTPKARAGTASCVTRALARHRRSSQLCALRRSEVLDRDPMTVAAARMRSRRVHVVNLTRFFCDRRHCFPVIGGALVHKDPTHITAMFASTLGPYLLRAVRGITG